MTPLPPKQGLKLFKDFGKPVEYIRYDTTSTKTRIETDSRIVACIISLVVMTPLPPKQGLKLDSNSFLRVRQYVMTPLPPKQGLKHRLVSSAKIQIFSL